MLGKLLGLPFRILNAPVRATEKILDSMCGGSCVPEDEKLLSMPLRKIAEAFEEIDEKAKNG